MGLKYLDMWGRCHITVQFREEIVWFSLIENQIELSSIYFIRLLKRCHFSLGYIQYLHNHIRMCVCTIPGYMGLISHLAVLLTVWFPLGLWTEQVTQLLLCSPGSSRSPGNQTALIWRLNLPRLSRDRFRTSLLLTTIWLWRTQVISPSG